MRNEQLEKPTSEDAPTNITTGLLGLLLLSAVSIGGALAVVYGFQWLLG